MFKGLGFRATSLRRVATVAGTLGIAAALSSTSLLSAQAYDQNFFLKPYLQLGFDGKKDGTGIDIVWFSEEGKKKWQVKYVTAAGKEAEAEYVNEHMISLPSFTAPCYKLTAHIHKIPAGDTFDYKVFKDGNKVFEATARSRKVSGQTSEVAIFGDCGINGEEQRKLSHQIAKANPDLAIIPGDIAYQYGLFSQYVTNFFPVYNADPAKGTEKEEKAAGTTPGVPLMRSVLFAGVLGNHDIALSGMVGTNLNKFPDALGYYIFWNEPLDGYTPQKDFGAKNFPTVVGDANRQELFKKSAGDAFPTMSNYSFDFGDAHYTCLDGNFYMDWTNPKLREWLADDLKNAEHKAWRILIMHQPGFLIGAPHAEEQKMRLVSDIAQKYKVDLVVAGHAHCYERSRPLTFDPPAGAKSYKSNPDGSVEGVFTLDKNWDGVKNTRPKGIVYIVSGAGGAHLYPINKQLVEAPDSYMTKYDSSVRSFSSVNVASKAITFKQITEDGKILDQFVISK